jgi:hypothetical protein
VGGGGGGRGGAAEAVLRIYFGDQTGHDQTRHDTT